MVELRWMDGARSSSSCFAFPTGHPGMSRKKKMAWILNGGGGVTWWENVLEGQE